MCYLVGRTLNRRMTTDARTGADAHAEAPDAHRPDASEQQVTDHVIDVALREFCRLPFGEAKLENIARGAGMSKRMIHYYFGDKRGLYQMALAEALRRLQPEQESMHVDSSIPVEGVARIVDALNQCFLEHSEAVAMVQMENAQRVLNLAEMPPLVDHTPVILNLDRLLLIGQDSGAFRPGISAYDIYYLVVSLLSRRSNTELTSMNLYGADMSSPTNVEGTHRMAVDAVLSFLTANISDTGHESYLTLEQHTDSDTEEQSAPSIYGEEDASSAIYGG